MALSPSRHRQRLHELQRHVVALRTFHIGLIAETHRHLYTLKRMAAHISILREAKRRTHEKLAAAESSCRELRDLERLKRPWQDIHRDFRKSLKRARAVLRVLSGSAIQARRKRGAGAPQN